jgi:predicted AlkP superfamily pyrophosphatase or phosphodiesterase
VSLWAGWTAEAVKTGAQPATSLVVMLVVDQMRADYLERFDRHWQRGFRTLVNEGLRFDNTRYPYINTKTCPGHATISTGTVPRTHGMVLNDWWHRDERRTLSCTDDPSAPDVTYGRPSKLGNSAKRLVVPTLADELRAQRPGARVVALSLKARSAIALAGHGGDAVVWFDDLAGSFVTSRAFASAPVPAVKSFVDRSPYERDLDRVWRLLGPPSSYTQRDSGLGERPPTPWSGLFPHVVAGRGGLDALFFDVWQTSPLADEYLGRMAADLVDGLALGQRDATDFLGISFTSLDEVGHDFGPDSREVEDLLRQLDVTLGTLVERLDARVGRERYVLSLSSDHGVAPIGGFARGGRIVTADVRDTIEDTLIAEFGPLAAGNYVEAANEMYVYLAPGVMDRLRDDAAVLRAVVRAVEEMPGVARLLRADEVSDPQGSAEVRGAFLGRFPGRSGDLIVVPEPYWYLHSRGPSSATSHGSLNSYDTHVPLILFGGGIRRGSVASPASPADIAPTLAHLAGLRMPKAEGRVLQEATR